MSIGPRQLPPMDDLEKCQRQLGDDILRGLVWAGRQVVRDIKMRMAPPRLQSIEVLAQALRDFRIAALLER
jgi:hypothetical protein